VERDIRLRDSRREPDDIHIGRVFAGDAEETLGFEITSRPSSLPNQ